LILVLRINFTPWNWLQTLYIEPVVHRKSNLKLMVTRQKI